MHSATTLMPSQAQQCFPNTCSKSKQTSMHWLKRTGLPQVAQSCNKTHSISTGARRVAVAVVVAVVVAVAVAVVVAVVAVGVVAMCVALVL
jgi:uncharacterized membrane protein YbaN (DUF454 family)